MKDFKRWLNESVLPTIQQAINILDGHKDRKDLVRRIQLADPYRDKRFAPIIADWVVKLGITPEEHAEDVRQFKELHRRLKDLRVPATNTQRTKKVKNLLSFGPEDFPQYSLIQRWNRMASAILDPDKDMSDDGLPVVMRHDGYTMYRIDKEEHCQVPLVKNSMGWCVTKGSFGGYGGPPYYPVVRDSDRSPFAMIIPAHFDEDPDQAVRNAQNDGRLSPSDLVKIRPLVKHVLPLYGHKHRYIYGVHGERTGLPENPSPEQALHIMQDYLMEPGEWPEGERTLERWPMPYDAYLYALVEIKGRWPAGEKMISGSAEWAYKYAKDIVKGPWKRGEEAISKDCPFAIKYATEVLRERFPLAEPAISQDPEYAYLYARNIIKGRWPAGEEAIALSAEWAYYYAVYVLEAPFPEGEKAIGKDPRFAGLYALYVAAWRSEA